MLRYLSLFSGIGAFEKALTGNSIAVDVLEELMCMMLDNEKNLLV